MNPSDLKKLKIGYGGYSKDFSVPGDRRRFCAFAKHTGFEIEFADPAKEYDIVYITYNSNLGLWIDYKVKRGSKVKLIFELIDSYLAENFSWKTILRGPLNYFTKRNSKFYFDFRNSIIDISKIADAIVCSTEEQRKEFLKYNKNVHQSLDIFTFDIDKTKTDYTIGPKLKIVWEGQPHTLHNVLSIKNVLNKFKDKIELHIVTDPHYFKYSNAYFKQISSDIIKDIKCDKTFYKWDKKTFSGIITNCDVSIIPINLNEKISLGKPENKLILLWNLGIPVLTSATPAYIKAQKLSNLNFVCFDESDWEEKISSFFTLTIEEKQNIQSFLEKVIKNHYSFEQEITNWENLIKSLI